MNKEYIVLNNKTIPIEFTNRVRRPRIYNAWDEFYIKCPKGIDISESDFGERNIQWMNKSIRNNKDRVNQIKNKIRTTKPTLLNRSKPELKRLVQKYLLKYKHKGIPNNISIRKDMDQSWATHSINHNMAFNYDLSMIPSHLIEYVVFHELCHFQEFEHNARFYELMREGFSNCYEYDLELNTYNYLILHNKRKKLNLE